MTFTEKLLSAVESSETLLCVGLDPDPERIPDPLKKQYREVDRLVYQFCTRIIEATQEHACAFKANTAFFETLGGKGWEILEKIAEDIPDGKIFIADAKRGDIGNTASKYKTAFFDQLGADALTINPLMGMDTLDPYLGEPSKALFVLAMTSNRGAADFLGRRFEGRMSLGEYIAEELAKKQAPGTTHLGMVVGATQNQLIEPVLKAHPSAHLLIPGIGAQGGSPEKLSEALTGHTGLPLISSSRSIIYAGGDDRNWEEKVSIKAAEFKDSIKKITDRYVS